MAAGFLSLVGLTKRYGDFAAVDGLDLEVAKGELMAFLDQTPDLGR